MKKLLANLIIMSLIVVMAGLSNATTSLVDPTRPAHLIDAVDEVVNEKRIDQKEGIEKQAESEPIPDYRLNAIKIGRSSRMAIINGETVSPGQNIGSAKLVKINSGSVVIDVNGKAITVSLLPDSIKKVSSKSWSK